MSRDFTFTLLQGWTTCHGDTTFTLFYLSCDILSLCDVFLIFFQTASQIDITYCTYENRSVGWRSYCWLLCMADNNQGEIRLGDRRPTFHMA
jgi:hypothetical protein